MKRKALEKDSGACQKLEQINFLFNQLLFIFCSPHPFHHTNALFDPACQEASRSVGTAGGASRAF